MYRYIFYQQSIDVDYSMKKVSHRKYFIVDRLKFVADYCFEGLLELLLDGVELLYILILSTTNNI